MGRTVELQPWITLRGATGWPELMQEVDDWLDVSNYKTASVRIELRQIYGAVTGCTLYLEGCDQSGGLFTTHKSLGSANVGTTMVYLLRQAPYGAAERLNNLLRWKVVGPGNNGEWVACFRITAVFK